jgi:hypothetical protein
MFEGAYKKSMSPDAHEDIVFEDICARLRSAVSILEQCGFDLARIQNSTDVSQLFLSAATVERILNRIQSNVL